VSQGIQLLSVMKVVTNVQGRESIEQLSNSKLSGEDHEPLRKFS
jgi:hypothetical protein